MLLPGLLFGGRAGHDFAAGEHHRLEDQGWSWLAEETAEVVVEAYPWSSGMLATLLPACGAVPPGESSLGVFAGDDVVWMIWAEGVSHAHPWCDEDVVVMRSIQQLFAYAT